MGNRLKHFITNQNGVTVVSFIMVLAFIGGIILFSIPNLRYEISCNITGMFTNAGSLLDAGGKRTFDTEKCVATSNGISEELVISNVQIEPENPKVYVNDTVPFGLNVVYTNGTKSFVTESATWTSANTAIASMNKNIGIAKSVGTTNITATYGGKSYTTSIIVENRPVTEPPGGGGGISTPESNILSIDVTPATATVELNGTKTYTAKANYKDGSASKDVTNDVEWTTSDSSIATLTNNTATGVSAGTAQIRATLEGVVGYGNLQVEDNSTGGGSVVLSTIVIEPTNISVNVSSTGNLDAYAVYSNGDKNLITPDASWSSANSAIASVTKVGAYAQVKGEQVGNTTVTATYQGKTATANVTVNVAAASVATMYITTNENTNIAQSVSQSLPDASSIKSVTVVEDTANKFFGGSASNVNLAANGNLTFNVTGATSPYTTSSKTATSSATKSSQTGFASSVNYNQDGFTGSLPKSGSPTVISGSPPSRSIDDWSPTLHGYGCEDGSEEAENSWYDCSDDAIQNEGYSGIASYCLPYSEGAYSGSLPTPGSESSKQMSALYGYWEKGGSDPPSGFDDDEFPEYFNYNYDGYKGKLYVTDVSKSRDGNGGWCSDDWSGDDGRVTYVKWNAYMSGTVSGPDTRVWEQKYSGTVTKKTYRYKIKVDYYKK